MHSLLNAWKNPSVRFVLVGTALYLGLYLLYTFYIHPHTVLDEWIIHNLVQSSESVLKVFGYDLIQYPSTPYHNRLGILGSSGLYIGEPCDGFILFMLFLSFILAFPGPMKHKFWFIPVGIIAIHLINVLRIIALAIIVYYHPDWLSFNHDYTFTVIVYSFVFFLWWIWVNKFAPRKLQQPS